MKIKKILNYKYNTSKDRVEYYSKLYKKTDFSVKYPAGLKRLNIIISLLYMNDLNNNAAINVANVDEINLTQEFIESQFQTVQKFYE